MGTAGCQLEAERSKGEPHLAAGEPEHSGVSSLSSLVFQHHSAFWNLLSGGELPTRPAPPFQVVDAVPGFSHVSTQPSLKHDTK